MEVKMSSKSKDYQLEKQEIVPTGDYERTRQRRAYVPRTDIYETEDSIFVVIDLPGINKDNLLINLEKNILTIRGEVDDIDVEGYQASYIEYEIGDYERRFTLSNEIDIENIKATLKDGVLHIEMPKIKEAKTRKIDVKVV
jgi:HSP20 family molecular chaperone IbpA